MTVLKAPVLVLVDNPVVGIFNLLSIYFRAIYLWYFLSHNETRSLGHLGVFLEMTNSKGMHSDKERLVILNYVVKLQCPMCCLIYSSISPVPSCASDHFMSPQAGKIRCLIVEMTMYNFLIIIVRVPESKPCRVSNKL